MCKSHFMIMTHSKCCLLFFTCLLWEGRTTYFLGGGRGWGGVSKRKTKSCTRKEGEKLVHKEAWENVYASLTYFWALYDGNVRKEILIMKSVDRE